MGRKNAEVPHNIAGPGIHATVLESRDLLFKNETLAPPNHKLNVYTNYYPATSPNNSIAIPSQVLLINLLRFWPFLSRIKALRIISLKSVCVSIEPVRKKLPNLWRRVWAQVKNSLPTLPRFVITQTLRKRKGKETEYADETKATQS